MTDTFGTSSAESGLLAIIPARGGSKRIPRKNIRPFLGIPLIARTIQTLLSTGLVDRVIVSTDDDEIAEVAESAGADAPFRRPSHLADDYCPTAPVVAHAIEWVEHAEGPITSPIVVAYPAAVFVTAADLQAAFSRLRISEVDVVVSAGRFPAPPMRAWRKTSDGYAEMIWPEHQLTRSQDLEESFFDAGQFYVSEKSYWSRISAQPAEQGITAALHVLPWWRACDIDEPDDWQIAEYLFRALPT